jgi:hypothetical protein
MSARISDTDKQRGTSFTLRLVLIVIGLALLLLLVLVLRNTFDPLAREQAAQELARRNALNNDLMVVDLVAGAAWRLLPIGLLLAGGYLGILVAYRRWADHRYIEAYHVTQLERARNASQLPALQSLNYHFQDSSRPVAPAQLPASTSPDPLLALPGPVDLASLSLPDKGVLIGLAAGGQPIVSSVGQLCHVSFLGSTGGGKTNLMRVILPQLLARGAKAALIDPHYADFDPETGENWRAIRSRLFMEPAYKAGEMKTMLSYFTRELAHRLERRRSGQNVGPALFLAFDELPVITKMVPTAQEAFGSILREGRKVGIYLLGATQSMLVKDVGSSSAIRDQFRTVCYLGGDRKSASSLLDLPEREIDDSVLGKGIALVRAAGQPPQLVRIPLASNEVIEHLLLTPTTPTSYLAEPTTQQNNRPFGFVPPTQPLQPVASSVASAEAARSGTEAATSQVASTASASPEAMEILRRYLAGESVSQIAKERNGGSTSGDRYRKILAEVDQLLREALKSKI